MGGLYVSRVVGIPGRVLALRLLGHRKQLGVRYGQTPNYRGWQPCMLLQSLISCSRNI